MAVLNLGQGEEVQQGTYTSWDIGSSYMVAPQDGVGSQPPHHLPLRPEGSSL